MLDQDDSDERARPVPDDAEEVDECLFEAFCTDDGERKDTAVIKLA